MKIKKHPVYVSKKIYEEKDVDLLLMREERKRNYVLIKDFTTFMYDHTLRNIRKHFCRYYLQSISIEDLLNSLVAFIEK